MPVVFSLSLHVDR